MAGAAFVASILGGGVTFAQTTNPPASVIITPDGGTPEAGQLTAGANGTLQVTVPFRQFAPHEIEFRDASGAVVDSASVTVTSVDGSTIDVTTAKGGQLVLTVSHHGGPNGAPSMGTGTYSPAAAPPASLATTSSSSTSSTTTTLVPPSTDRLGTGSPSAATASDESSRTAWWIALIAIGVVLAAVGVAVARRAEPADYDDCSAVYGWSITLKWEHSEPYSFLGITGASEEQAGRNGNQLLRNRLTNQRPAIDTQLQEYADGIGCRAPCVKRVEFKEDPEHWDDPVARGDKVVCYVRKTIEVIVYCEGPAVDT
jgi:hypothetical protein